MSNIYIQEPPSSGKVCLKTSVGDIDIELWTRECPLASRNFIQLCMEGYYDDTIFHRVVPEFIVQGGDPTGTGQGGESIYGHPFKDEFHSRLRFVRRGLLAMANAGTKNDNTSQFFFTLARADELQDKHTIFGKIVGDTLFNMLKLGDTSVDVNERPHLINKILKTEVLLNPFEDIEPRTKQRRRRDGDRKPKSKSKATKNFNLLSFGDEAEEEEAEIEIASKNLSGKGKSAHEILEDENLSSEPAVSAEQLASHVSESEEQTEEDKALERKNKIQSAIKNKLLQKNADEDVEPNADDDDKADEFPEEEPFEIWGTEKKAARVALAQAKAESEELKREVIAARRKKDLNEDIGDESDPDEEPMVKQFRAEKKQYKAMHKEQFNRRTNPIERERQTMDMLDTFKSRLEGIKDESEPVQSGSSDVDDANPEPEDFKDNSWMIHEFKIDVSEKVREAKDANRKTDEDYDMHDPRNAIVKRRRQEATDAEEELKKRKKPKR